MFAVGKFSELFTYKLLLLIINNGNVFRLRAGGQLLLKGLIGFECLEKEFYLNSLSLAF